MNNHETAYSTQTIKVGNATVCIHRPILTDKERLKQEEIVKTALANFGKYIYKEKNYGN